jgi:hypothetical protein
MLSRDFPFVFLAATIVRIKTSTIAFLSQGRDVAHGRQDFEKEK